jgi:hypothetical protein|tara:strand:+ start:4084 stop:4749 length:666 start_codon:yes stop_codon:yes gene_type:complete
MSFKSNNYLVIKEALDSNVANFIYQYFSLKKQVARTLFDSRYISQFTSYWGVWSDPQAPETYSHYADVAMETLLQKVKPIMEEKTGLKLVETYSYARLYKKGDVLKRHKDRFSCEISTTMNLGGDPWPIFIEPDKSKGYDVKAGENKKRYMPSDSKGIKVDLNPGDMLVYRGMELEHWREKFEGNDCCQVFLHYNNSENPNAEKNKFDGRKHLGLPAWFKK